MTTDTDDQGDERTPSPGKGRRRPLDTLERVRRELGRLYFEAKDGTMPMDKAKGLTYLLSQVAAVLRAEAAPDAELAALIEQARERLRGPG